MYVLSPVYMYSCVLTAFHNKRISINHNAKKRMDFRRFHRSLNLAVQQDDRNERVLLLHRQFIAVYVSICEHHNVLAMKEGTAECGLFAPIASLHMGHLDTYPFKCPHLSGLPRRDIPEQLSLRQFS